MADFDFGTVGSTSQDTAANAATKARYEANADTNAFTDAEQAKLAALNSANYATTAQGAKADTALQPSGSPSTNQYLKSGGGTAVTGQTGVPYGDVTGKPALLTVSGTPTAGQIGVFTSSTVLAGQTGLPFADLTGKPTTLVGYGITDAEPLMAVSVVSTTPVALADADNRRFRHLTHATPTVTIPAGLTVGTAFSFTSANSATLTAASGVTLNGVDGDSVTIAPVPGAVTVLIVAANTAIVIGQVS